MAQFKSEFRQKEREVAQLLDSLQRHEMTKDDLRRSDRELKQFKTKSQLSETRNRELTTQVRWQPKCIYGTVLAFQLSVWLLGMS